jgi:thiazole/oxazole-forming peptide maturase SagD family component
MYRTIDYMLRPVSEAILPLETSFVGRVRSWGYRFLARQLGAVLTATDLQPALTSYEPHITPALFKNLTAVRALHGLLPLAHPHDEPPLLHIGIHTKRTILTESVLPSESAQLVYSALIEAARHHIHATFNWAHNVRVGPSADIEHALDLRKLAGYSQDQKTTYPDLRINSGTRFDWVKGVRLGTTIECAVPLQLVSMGHARAAVTEHTEPLLRPPVCAGLGVARSATEAQLQGLLRLIADDAFAITWAHHMRMQRVHVQPDARLQELLTLCSKYRIIPHFFQLVSDAPTCVLLCLVEDSTTGPLTLGRVAADARSASAAYTALKAVLSARIHVRAHDIASPLAPYRAQLEEYVTLPHTPPWLDTQSTPRTLGPVEYESDTASEHLTRLIEWLRSRQYSPVSVACSSSVLPKGLYAEHVVVPELIPACSHTLLPALGGGRLESIPLQFGFPVRPLSLAESGVPL